MRKAKLLKEKGIDTSKIKKRPNTNRYYIYLKDTKNNISANSQEELIDKLYNQYCHLTLSSILDEYCLHRKHHTALGDRSIQIQRTSFKKFWENSDIANKPLEQLTANDFILFFMDLTKNRDITRKQFNDIKYPVSQMLYYAVLKNYISHQILKDIDFNQFTYLNDEDYKRKHTPYTIKERNQLLDFLFNLEKMDGYYLAICLQIFTCCRIGEIKGILKDDILPDGYVYINHQSLEVRSMNDDFTFSKTEHVEVNHVKAHSRRGKRNIKLNKSALYVVELAMQLDTSNDLLFSFEGRPLTTSTYNRRLKSICNKINIPYHPSHQIRFVGAGTLLEAGYPISVIQKVLGHTTEEMTKHYVEAFRKEELMGEEIAEALDFTGLHE